MQHCRHKSVKKYFLLQLLFFFFWPNTDATEVLLCLLLLAIIFFLQTPKQQDLLCLRPPIQSGCKKDFGETGAGGKNSCCSRQSGLSPCPWLHFLWIAPTCFHPPMCLPGTGQHAAPFLVLWNTQGHEDEMRSRQRDRGTGRLRGKVISNAQKKKGWGSDNKSLQRTAVTTPVV